MHDSFEAVAADAAEVRRRFVEMESSDVEPQQVILFVVGCMLALAAALAAAAYCCGLGSSPHSDGEPLCHGLLVPTVLDALFGGNRRRRALRPLSSLE